MTRYYMTKLENTKRQKLYKLLRQKELNAKQANRIRDWSYNHIKQYLQARNKTINLPKKWFKKRWKKAKKQNERNTNNSNNNTNKNSTKTNKNTTNDNSIHDIREGIKNGKETTNNNTTKRMSKL